MARNIARRRKRDEFVATVKVILHELRHRVKISAITSTSIAAQHQ
jgi:hypothetical protein